MADEKKYTLEELENLLDEDANGGSSLNFQTIFAALVLNWQWFLLSLIICVCGALIYLRYSEPVYQVSARMLIKDENPKKNTAQALSNMQDLGFLTNSTGIENEMEVLQSRILLRDVVKDLKIYTEYRINKKNGLTKWKGYSKSRSSCLSESAPTLTNRVSRRFSLAQVLY